MSESFEKQPDMSCQPEQAEVWDMANLLAFFKLLFEVDKRLNPQDYEVKNNDWYYYIKISAR